MNAAPPAGPLRIRKMHGAGNDFVVIDARDGRPPLAPALARALADRRTGVGCDQVVEIRAASAADARLVFLNPDGSEAGACGNATRCVADLLMRETGAAALTLATRRGALQARRRPDGRVEVDMGAPLLDWRDIPLAREADTLALPLDAPFPAAAVSMGNPHCVLIVPDAETAPVETLGPRLERDPLFPERANVEFAEILSRGRVRLRVWERGTGATPACGSGACATLVALVRLGRLDRRATLVMDGGELEAAWPDDAAGVTLSGPVAHVFEATLEPAALLAEGPA
ncbi:MAG: diaminopimelate epimerase [Paracoccaceae bacterium]